MRHLNKSMIIKIKNLRESKGLSQRDLSEATKKLDPTGRGLSPSYIGMIESGRISPSIKALDKMATALGVTRAYLLEEDNKIDFDDFKDQYSLKEKEFLAKEENKGWVGLNTELAAKGMTPERVRKALQTLMRVTMELSEPEPNKEK